MTVMSKQRRIGTIDCLQQSKENRNNILFEVNAGGDHLFRKFANNYLLLVVTNFFQKMPIIWW